MRLRNDDGYEICDDPDRLDLGRVHEWLSTDAYWALGRTRETVERSIAGSVSYGLYDPDDKQIGFARMVTDRATFAWLCDVYVDRDVRGKGLGTWLVQTICDDIRTESLRRILLATVDAHGVYANVGFTPLVEPERWMEMRLRP